MKSQRKIILGLGMTGLGWVVAALWVNEQSPNAGEISRPVLSRSQQRTSLERPSVAWSGDQSVVRGAGKNSRTHAPERLVQVFPNLILATVNGAPIRAEHLVSLNSLSQKISMEARSYNERLQRAIEAELVFQAARDRGVGFTASQRRRLDKIRSVHQANLADLSSVGVTWDSLDDAQVDLEERTMASMMLRQNLVAADRGARPSPDRNAQVRYETALADLLEELRNRSEIHVPADPPG